MLIQKQKLIYTWHTECEKHLIVILSLFSFFRIKFLDTSRGGEKKGTSTTAEKKGV